MTNQPDFKNESFEELFNQSVANVKSFERQLAKGKVIGIEKGHVLVDVGLKSEGRIPVEEFQDEDGNNIEVKIGDVIDVFIDKYEDKNGVISLSKEKARREEVWYKLEELCANGTTVEGLITRRVKGGFMVLVKNTIAFLPGSQLDLRPIKNINSLVGTKQELKILTMDRKRYNIVVSRKAIIEQKLKEDGVVLGKSFKEGQVVEGVVKNITGYGAFIDLGSIDGLLHVTDISWSRVNHPSEILKVGQNIQVKVVKIHPETDRISLGIKQLTEDPWVNIDKKYEAGNKFKVKVTNITDYGIFVELEKGVEGLVHVSEISWGKSSKHPSDEYKPGDEVEAIILDIDSKKRRISLSIKQCVSNPWLEYSKKNPDGTNVKGTIKALNENGVVVSLTDDIEGFIKNSDLSWDKPEEEVRAELKEGDNIEVKILRNDIEKERILLGIKQLVDDPFAASLSSYNKGDVVSAKITKITEKGLNAEVGPEAIKAFIKKSDISLDKDNQKPSNFNEGDIVEAIITSINHDDRSFNLSIKAVEQIDHKKHLDNKETLSNNLGDILNEALNKKNNT